VRSSTPTLLKSDVAKNVAQLPELVVRDLSVTFRQYDGGLKRKSVTPITELDVVIHPGEILAVIGSSGSGKSLLAHAILGILPSNAVVTGSMLYRGEELTAKRQAMVRGKGIALVPQAVTYLNPLMRVGAQVRTSVRNGDASLAQKEVFQRYHLRPDSARLFPFQLSGGMARRVLSAAAAVTDATLIIADEPTPGLHSAVVDETLGHLRELADEGRAVMLITHDVSSALTVADRIAVFYAGTTVEVAPAASFRGSGEALRHPYSKALWQALPQNGFEPMPGTQPASDELPAGCLFEPRCADATFECAAKRPEPREFPDGMVRCRNAS